MKPCLLLLVLLLFGGSIAERIPDIFVLPDLGISLLKFDEIASYKEVDSLGLQIKLKVPELKTPKLMKYDRKLMPVFAQTLSKDQKTQIQTMNKCIETWEFYERHLLRVLNSSHSCSHEMIHAGETYTKERKTRSSELEKLEDNQAAIKKALRQQVKSDVRVVGTLESFQSFVNREMTEQTCLLEVQTLYMDLVHDFGLFKERVRQLRVIAVGGEFQLEDLDLDEMVLEEILQNSIFENSYEASTELLLKHARLHPVAACQNFNDSFIGFSFILVYPRVQKSFPVYEMLQTGFYPAGDNRTCLKIDESSQIVMKGDVFFNFGGCRKGMFGLCTELNFARSLSDSCLNNSTENSCPVFRANCAPFNLEELPSGVLVTSASEVRVYNENGDVTKMFEPHKSSFVRWTEKAHAIHVGERMIFNPNDEYNTSLNLNISYLAEYDYNNSLFSLDDHGGVLNMSTIRELKNVNKRIDETIDSVDLKFYDVSSDLRNNGIMSYTSFSVSFVLMICCVVIGVISSRKCTCKRGKQPINDTYMP